MITQEQLRYKKILSIIAGAMLLFAIPSIWPYGYYQLLRWVITGSAIFNAVIAHELNKTMLAFVMGSIAIIFNPIMPLYLDKDVWIVIDLIAAAVFLVSLKIKTKQ